MPTRPSPKKNFPMGFAERWKKQKDKERIARLNAAVDAENAAKKAVADVKSFTSKPKAVGTPLGRFGGQMAAMENTAAKEAAKKAANDRSDVQMSKRVQSPTNTEAATEAAALRRLRLIAQSPNTTPRQSPNPSQKPMTSSPRPPQKPMTSSPRPPKRPGFKAGGSVRPCKMC